ncbi:palmitoyltransferase swf1 [Didymella heteroderae]|uniref:Palmitoyltransferase swf1 n=1 Tax=Didymella heteroderae TaxID=1769908 RepID=A0A9P5C3T4_9PLEO|nr:palmitoyltransferase swf1 [Didymella heteroderae]
MSGELTRKEARAQQVQQQSASQGARDVETQEHHAKASASGGLNLNLFGALSGALSSKSKKTTHTNADGSSTSVEDRHDKAAANALANGSAQAFASADAEEGGKKTASREVAQSASQGRAVSASKKVDHLGIES